MLLQDGVPKIRASTKWQFSVTFCARRRCCMSGTGCLHGLNPGVMRPQSAGLGPIWL